MTYALLNLFMSRKIYLFISWIIFSLAPHLDGQESISLLKNDYYMPSSSEYAAKRLYGIALGELEKAEFNDAVFTSQARVSYSLDESRSIDLLLESISRSNDYTGDSKIFYLIAEKYFERKDYKSARAYYLKADYRKLESEQSYRLKFKLAYTYLLEKRFGEAITHFNTVSNSSSSFQYKAKYYEGVCAFYLGERDMAINLFTEIESRSEFKRLVPFYLAQIYFKNEEYDKAIKYAKTKNNSRDSNAYLLDRIMGLSYLAQEDYGNARTYLESYEQVAKNLSENDAFQLGVINYRLGDFQKAEPYFLELSYQESPIGQMSNFLLASSYIENAKKKDAQSAFKQASKLQYFPDIREESEFMYYKISADLGDERIAIGGLSGINTDSPYYSESQNLLSSIFFNSQDTEAALSALEAIPRESTELKNTYQELLYRSGMQFMAQNDHESAIAQFKKAEEVESNLIDTAELRYRLGHAYSLANNYSESISYLQSYLASDHSEHIFESYYLMAYIEIFLEDYDMAIQDLEEAVNNFDPESDNKSLIDDAIVRLADLELVKNNYTAALEYYELAIQSNAEDSDYILYQKSMIYGVNNQIIEKLTSLEKLLKSYPESNYRDDALFQLGETLVQLKKNNQAYQVYNTIIIEYGDRSEYTPTSYMRQGLISYNQGDLYAALDAYKQGIEKSKDKNERRRAILAVEDIYLYDLNDPDAYFKYSETLTGVEISDISRDSIVFGVALDIYKDGKYEKAIEQLNKYLDQRPIGFYKQDAEYYLAESYLVLKDYDKALANYLNVIESDNPQFVSEALEKAAVIAHNYKKDCLLSLSLHESIISRMEQRPELKYLEPALYCAKELETDSSILKYGELISSHIGASDELKASAHFYMANSLYKLNKPDEATMNYKLVTELTDNSQAAESNYQIAKILYQNNDFEGSESRAFITAEKSAKFPYWVAKSILLLADIYVHKKDYLNATAAYESVLENFSDNTALSEEADKKLKALQKQIEKESRIIESDTSSFMISDTIQNK